MSGARLDFLARQYTRLFSLFFLKSPSILFSVRSKNFNIQTAAKLVRWLINGTGQASSIARQAVVALGTYKITNG